MLLPERFRQHHLAGVQRRLADDSPPLGAKSVEVIGRRKDGGEFPLELSVAR
ncbi:MAG: hypothetical protein IPP88_18340 [Betaproteobacteria bacterium]|nr:hypothetical protein [Betaproteobacteria bacterium]